MVKTVNISIMCVDAGEVCIPARCKALNELWISSSCTVKLQSQHHVTLMTTVSTMDNLFIILALLLFQLYIFPSTNIDKSNKSMGQSNLSRVIHTDYK